MRVLAKVSILFLLLLGLPMAGILLAGYPAAGYLEFPPRTQYVSHAAFSWAAFLACALIVLAMVLPLVTRILTSMRLRAPRGTASRPFPWWGWAGVASGTIAWLLAWTRFHWFSSLQSHTFLPLWFSYILVINALTFRRSGRCMMLDDTRRFARLFPLSAAFWWFFEYLNRFVQNWHYAGWVFHPLEYFLYATLSFSTVLPAVLGTREWILTFPWIQSGFGDWLRVRPGRPRCLAWITLLVSAVGLAGIGVWPSALYPLLWLAPLSILVSLQTLLGEDHVFSGLTEGDWRAVVSAGTAALVCGFFWEMWNDRSLLKWQYRVPLVHRFQVFEMPLLGYAGYLPFGIECLAVAELFSPGKSVGKVSAGREASTPALGVPAQDLSKSGC